MKGNFPVVKNGTNIQVLLAHAIITTVCALSKGTRKALHIHYCKIVNLIQGLTGLYVGNTLISVIVQAHIMDS